MIIWFLLIIPFISAVFLVYKYHHKVTWWEYLILFGGAIFLIAITKFIGEKSLTNATEFWGDLVQRVEHHEEYVIQRHKICERDVPDGKDSDGNPKTRTEEYNCPYLERHPENWKAITVSGWEFSISKAKYLELMNRFGAQPTFRNMDRRGDLEFRDKLIKDGNMYYGTWKGESEKSYAVSKTNTYENKVQASNSVFNFRKIKKEEAEQNGLFDYPKIKDWRIPTVLGGKGIENISEVEDRFHFLNGNLGPKKQLRVWVLLFKNKPLSTALSQEAYWIGGQKNEFVVCIGVDDSLEVQWCYPFSWTEVHELKINTRNFVIDQKKLDLISLSEYLYSELGKKWKRKEFKDFDYLTVEPPLWALITAFILQILFNVGHGIWAVRNEFENY